MQEKFILWKEAVEAYYNSDSPIMSDPEFDNLTQELLDNGTPDIIEFINNTVENKEASSEGLQLSLKKIKFKDKSTFSEIQKFFKFDIKKKYLIAPKFDGCSLRINLKEDVITTRGGVNVKDKFASNPSVQKSISKYSDLDYIVGELVISKKVFNDKYSGIYENPRNIVAGFLNSKNINPDIDPNDFEFIHLTDGTNPLDWKEIDDLSSQTLNQIRFEKLIEYFRSDEFPYLVDGIVIAYQTDKREVENNYPLNMVAVKFPNETVITEVTGIQWTQKKLKKLTPVLDLKPVKLQGSTITACSGYNYDYLLRNHIGVGSIIEITKSGDIIPVPLKVIKRSDNIVVPNGTKVEGKNLVYIESNIDVKVTKFTNAFKSLNIEGIGDKNCESIGGLIDYDIIKVFDPEFMMKALDVYRADSSIYQKLLKIKDIKIIYLDHLIYMLQFDNVGKTTSEKLAAYATGDKSVSNISGEVMNFIRFEGLKIIQSAMNELKSYGIRVVVRNNNEDSMTFEMTGNPPGMTKDEFYKKIKTVYPNILHTSLGKDTNYLVTDDMSSNTGKMNKARKYNVKIITYSDVLSGKVKL